MTDLKKRTLLQAAALAAAVAGLSACSKQEAPAPAPAPAAAAPAAAPAPAQGLNGRRRPVVRPDEGVFEGVPRRIAGERDAPHLLRVAGRPRPALAGRGDASAEGSRQADGDREFAVDAGKVTTIEKGWRDLKIAVALKRPTARPATPAQWESRELPGATARVMWADISAARSFRRSWHVRLRRLGLPALARLHVLGDGASWVWVAAGRALTGCRQTLDIFHACEHVAAAGRRLYGEETAEAGAFHERGRELLLKEGWVGICRLIGEELAAEDAPRRRRALDRTLANFLPHKGRIDYLGRLAVGEAIGSGGMEGAAKTLGLRMKARGARWRHRMPARCRT